MSTILFDKIIFGPVYSRRLGRSLGINLLPTKKKFCNFNCVYCECGWTKSKEIIIDEFPSKQIVKEALKNKLTELLENNQELDNITFAGNGEPTIHPEFNEVINDTIELRNKYFKDVKISVLTNATTIGNTATLEALNKIDNCILKLDAGTEETYNIINNPLENIKLSEIVENIKKFSGKIIIQSLFVRGEIKSQAIDNTTENEIYEWLKYIKYINPEFVMIYPIARPTPSGSLKKITTEELNKIAEKVERLGIKAIVY